MIKLFQSSGIKQIVSGLVVENEIDLVGMPRSGVACILDPRIDKLNCLYIFKGDVWPVGVSQAEDDDLLYFGIQNDFCPTLGVANVSDQEATCCEKWKEDGCNPETSIQTEVMTQI